MPASRTATMMAGIPAVNNALYRRIRFCVFDPVVMIELQDDSGRQTTLIVRDIEMERAKRHARADVISCPADFTPESGLSGDRETATAQAAAEMLRRAGVERVIADRSLPLIYAHAVQEAGIAIDCDTELGVADRRAKDEQEIECLRHAQNITEGAIELACRMVARAKARGDGVLVCSGEPLTSERVRTAVDVWLLKQGFSNPECIVAGGADGGDCHNLGSGQLYTEQPVIIDIFPRDRKTLYNGDCTRTVVHGATCDELQAMHAAVVEAKAAAIAATRAGVTGEAVHETTSTVIKRHGFAMGFPDDDAPDSYCGMVHGTGHGVGLDVHEPPLLDKGGPELVVGDVLTIEPGIYRKQLGGIRVEDMVVVNESGCENLNRLQEGLIWE